MINMQSRKPNEDVKEFPKPAIYELPQLYLKDVEQCFLHFLWPCAFLTLKAAIKHIGFRVWGWDFLLYSKNEYR